MFKKMFFLVLLLLVFSVTPLYAAEEVIIAPQASSVFLSYGSGIAENGSSITCTAFSNLTNHYQQSITMRIQRYENGSWKTLKSWSDSDNYATLDVMGGYPLSPGLYRVKSTHSAGGEVRTSYSPNYLID